MKIRKLLNRKNVTINFTPYANLKGDILIKKMNIFQAGANFIETTHIFI